MRTLLLVLCLAAGVPARAGYEEAVKAAPPIGDGADPAALLQLSNAELARSAPAMRLLKENRTALELFRLAAAEGEGRLAVPGTQRPAPAAPESAFAAQLRFYRLLLLDARIALAAERPGDAEKDLLAAAGFISHAAAERSFPLAGRVIAQLALAEAYPLFRASLRGGAAAPAYMDGLARRLEAAAAAQDRLRADIRAEGEALKGAFAGSVSGEKLREWIDAMPLMERLAARRLIDEETVALAAGVVSAEADARVKALSEAVAANDAAPLDRLRDGAAALRAGYPAPGALGWLKAWMFPDRRAKETMAFGMAGKFLSAEPPDYSGIIPRYHVFYNALNVLRAGLAVKRFQRARRRLPSSLGQLVPRYLPAVPADTFTSSGTLVYAKGKKTFSVYSVGPDRADGGGRAALDLRAFTGEAAANSGDIVFHGD